MQRFTIVVPKDDGGLVMYPMKQWLRQHPDQVPPGQDATSSTSHQLRAALKRRGWTVQDLDSEVRLFMPGHTVNEMAVDAVLGETSEPEETAPPEARFGLEGQLRDFIAQNMNAIDFSGRKLKLFVDQTGRDGIEYPSTVGLIDILATDEQGGFVVFELKRARSPDSAIGQLARYMGWVQQTIGKGKAVSGVILASEIGDALRFAVSVVPNVSLFEYQVSFTVKKAHELPGSP